MLGVEYIRRLNRIPFAGAGFRGLLTGTIALRKIRRNLRLWLPVAVLGLIQIEYAYHSIAFVGVDY